MFPSHANPVLTPRPSPSPQEGDGPLQPETQELQRAPSKKWSLESLRGHLHLLGRPSLKARPTLHLVVSLGLTAPLFPTGPHLPPDRPLGWAATAQTPRGAP